MPRRKVNFSPYGVVAEKGYLGGSELFINGCLTIQDESSMLVAPERCKLNRIIVSWMLVRLLVAKRLISQLFLEAEAGGRVTSLDIHAHKN